MPRRGWRECGGRAHPPPRRSGPSVGEGPLDRRNDSPTHRMLAVGQTARRSLTLTPDHVATYAKLTGDYNPLHFDAGFAARTKFGKLVVQGGLTTGLLH